MGGATTLVVKTKNNLELLKLDLRITNDSGVTPIAFSRMENLTLEGSPEVLSQIVSWAAVFMMKNLVRKEQLVPSLPT